MISSCRHAGRFAAWLVAVVAFWPLLASSEENERPGGTVLVDIRPESPAAPWIAGALEQNISREILGYQHIQVVDRREVDTSACGESDNDCRLRRYGQAGIDIVMTGTVAGDKLHYDIFECWTPSRVTDGSFDLGSGMSMTKLKQQILGAAAPFLKKGGLLDEKPFYELRRMFPAGTATAETADAHRPWALGIVWAAIAVFFAIPLLLFWRIRSRFRSRRWSLALVISAAVLAVHCWTDWLSKLLTLVDPDSYTTGFLETLWAGVASWEWLIAIAGGMAWGGFLLLLLKIAFPPVGGMDRVGHMDVLRLLKSWLVVCAQRLVLLLAFYTPFSLLFWWISGWYPAYQRFAFILLAPLVGLLLRAWFLALVENCSHYIDDRLVDGPATAENPWHHDVKKYFEGYLNRTGWSVDQKLLDRVLFLPGKNDEVLCYGGGITHPRILIPNKLLLFAIGEPEEIPPESRFVPWSDWLASTVRRSGNDPQPSRPGPLAALGRMLKPFFSRSPKRRLDRPGRSSRKKMLGQAATSLGYVMPFPPEELVPLIADDTEDFEIVRELLAEHYAWFEPDPSEVSDDTDPTDKDFLFGVLVREIGQVQCQVSQTHALFQAVQLRLAGGWSWLRKAGRAAVEIHQRLFSRAPAVLADGYAALNLARHHFIQYLYYTGFNKDELLTARADGPELQRISTEIFKQIGATKPDRRDRQLRRATIRNRLVWMSQFFHSALAVPKKRWIRILVGTIVGLSVITGGFFLVKHSVDYHPTYVQRIAEQQRKIEESKRKSMRDDKGNKEHGQTG